MDLRKLKALVDLVSESSITELEITEAEGKVRIVKASPVAMVPTATAMHVVAAPATSSEPSSAAVPPASAAPSSAPAAPPDAGRMIKSPMVGTFYRSASPGAKSFVDVGSVVKPGEPVCIIEAMKIMNEIEADIGGTIVRILCENGQAVEYGQPLFVVE
ncbi:MAG: acetyl-CoA carboxylase biotin carboxyl carrier protein [Rubrivivax sp.]